MLRVVVERRHGAGRAPPRLERDGGSGRAVGQRRHQWLDRLQLRMARDKSAKEGVGEGEN